MKTVKEQKAELIVLMKQVKFSSLPGGRADISVANQLPDHAFEAIVDHLMANGVEFVMPDGNK